MFNHNENAASRLERLGEGNLEVRMPSFGVETSQPMEPVKLEPVKPKPVKAEPVKPVKRTRGRSKAKQAEEFIAPFAEMLIDVAVQNGITIPILTEEQTTAVWDYIRSKVKK